MNKADNRRIGKGLSLRQVRDALNSVREEDLDKGMVVLGRNWGYDFVSYVGPAESDLVIGTPEDNSVLQPAGFPVIQLQDMNIVFET